MNWIAFVLYLLLVHGEAIVVAIFNVWLMTWRESEMPIATVSDEPEHYDLKTLPGAFVKIRRMDHGERMQRQQLLNKTRMNLRRGSKDVSVDMDLVNAAVTMYEWANLIVAHNLEYLTQPGNPDTATKLDFTNPEHVRMVNGRTSEEIDTYIGEVNNFEMEESDDRGRNS